MKKVLALVLVVLMVLGMTVHAFAEENPNTEIGSMLPIVSEGSSAIVIFYNMNDLQNLSEEEQAMMDEAHATLDEARPDHLALRNFCMAQIVGSDGSASVVFEPIAHNEIQFKQYVDGAWVLHEHTVNEDGTITVDSVESAPLAIFANDVHDVDYVVTPDEGRDSAEADQQNLVPTITGQSSRLVLLHSTEMVPHLSEEVQALMSEAKTKLKDACPHGCAAKFFCYVEIIGEGNSATVVFEDLDYSEIHFEQYIDGEWVELSYRVNEDGTITVDNVVQGPKVIFVK